MTPAGPDEFTVVAVTNDQGAGVRALRQCDLDNNESLPALVDCSAIN